MHAMQAGKFFTTSTVSPSGCDRRPNMRPPLRRRFCSKAEVWKTWWRPGRGSLNPSFPNLSISFEALAEPDFCLYDLHELLLTIRSFLQQLPMRVCFFLPKASCASPKGKGSLGQCERDGTTSPHSFYRPALLTKIGTQGVAIMVHI
jgi:hypothetical protein